MPGPGAYILPKQDIYSSDYKGSSDEWLLNSARSMAERYMAGDESMLQSLSGATAGIGQPSRADYGTAAGGGTGSLSTQTLNFFVTYLSKYAQSDPYVQEQYGVMPGQTATYGPDPNSAAEIQKGTIAANRESAALAAKTNKEIAEIEARSRASVAGIQAGADVASAGISAAGAANVATINAAASWREAQLADATRRYIADGDWGVQKWVVEKQEAGMLTRLTMELGMRDRELAQRALEAKELNHREMVNLTLEVAKYDAELAANPRNWVAYAAWLRNRDIVVDGLSLAIAADVVAPDQASAAAAQMAHPATALAAAIDLKVASQSQTTNQAPAAPASDIQATPGTTATSPYTVNGVDLNTTDYAGLARQLLNTPGAGTSGTGSPNTQQLQQVSESFNTSRPGSRVADFAAWGGPTTNALGVEVSPSGQKQDYRQFTNLLPVQQSMSLGNVASVRGDYGVADFLQEMDKSRPKGAVTSSATGYG